MALVKPVYGPDYGKLLAQSLGAYSQMKNIQSRGAEEAKTAEVKDLSVRASADPEAMARLTLLDPSRALQIQKLRDFEDRRFRQERAISAGQIENIPANEQISSLKKRVELIVNRGGDPSNTQGLLDLLSSGDPKEWEQAQNAIRNARVQGEREGFLKPAPRQSTTNFDRYMALSRDPVGSPAYNKRAEDFLKKSAGGVTITMPGEQTEQKELGKLRAQGLQAIRQRGELAHSNIASLDILDNIDVSTGKSEPMKQTLAAWGNSFGIDTKKLANVPAGEAYTAEAGKVVLNAMQAQKGPQTESDMRQIRTTVSGLGKSPEANQFINNSARAMSLRAIEQRDFYDNYLSENDTLKGASKEWNKYKRDVPMVSKGLKTSDGLPMFYYQFEKLAQDNNPGIDRQTIIMNWNSMDKEALKKRK